MRWRRQWQPLQCSCLENPRDGWAWWAAIYGVAQSQTRLKWLSLVSLNLTLVSWVLIYRNVFIFFFFWFMRDNQSPALTSLSACSSSQNCCCSSFPGKVLCSASSLHHGDVPFSETVSLKLERLRIPQIPFFSAQTQKLMKEYSRWA